MIKGIIRRLRYAYYDNRGNPITRLHPKYAKYEIGNYTYGFPIVYDWKEGTTLKIGKFCSIAKGVKIYLGGQHRMDWVSTFPFNEFFDEAKHIKGHPKSKGDVIIENDVWIGGDVTILSGVTLSNGCVAGAGSVITRDVPPYAVVAGNPARIIRYRFDDEIIEALQIIKWWDWSMTKIKSSFGAILSENVREFIMENKI